MCPFVSLGYGQGKSQQSCVRASNLLVKAAVSVQDSLPCNNTDSTAVIKMFSLKASFLAQ